MNEITATPDTPTMTSEELKRWRFDMGRINQPTAAKLLGVSGRTITAWESGRWPVPLAMMYACQWLLQAHARSASEDRHEQSLFRRLQSS